MRQYHLQFQEVLVKVLLKRLKISVVALAPPPPPPQRVKILVTCSQYKRLSQPLRQWYNIKPTLGQRFVFAG